MVVWVYDLDSFGGGVVVYVCGWGKSAGRVVVCAYGRSNDGGVVVCMLLKL